MVKKENEEKVGKNESTGKEKLRRLNFSVEEPLQPEPRDVVVNEFPIISLCITTEGT